MVFSETIYLPTKAHNPGRMMGGWPLTRYLPPHRKVGKRARKALKNQMRF